jgi:hypothetical protein
MAIARKPGSKPAAAQGEPAHLASGGRLRPAFQHDHTRRPAADVAPEPGDQLAKRPTRAMCIDHAADQIDTLAAAFHATAARDDQPLAADDRGRVRHDFIPHPAQRHAGSYRVTA